MRRMNLFLVIFFTSCPFLDADEPNAQGIKFFENKIRPVLVKHCYKCHSQETKKLKGGLLLDSRDAMRQGGDSGHAVVPNNIDDSLLIGAINYDSFEMPPSGPLPEEVIKDFEKWVNMGAPDPRESTFETVTSEIDIEKGRQYWAFQTVPLPVAPSVETSDWALDELDSFILAKLEAKQLIPMPDASPAEWLRRVTFDLTGLPPTLDEITAFESDKSPQAHAKVVDRLLDSDHFGERWGRHWFDVVRYAESIGRTRNYPFPFAWRYRDYVINAFNNDKPFNRFVVEQLAGDLLPYDSKQQHTEQIVATGFLAIGSHDLNERNKKQFQMDVSGEQIDVVSRALMGLTVGCARCHDHKFDPIPTHDYYALAGIFNSTKTLNGYGSRQGGNNQISEQLLCRLDEKPTDTNPVAKTNTDQADHQALSKKQQRRAKRELAQAKRNVGNLQQQIKEINKNKKLAKQEKNAQVKPLRQQLRKAQNRLKQLTAKSNKKNKGRGRKVFSGPYAMGVQENDSLVNCRIHIRGDIANLGDEVPRGVLQVLTETPLEIPSDASGRYQLAEWLVDPSHPLTARVYVNRIWHHLFGAGIVRTTDNFGEMGSRPTHPKLLDYLAHQFVEQDWSTKALIRRIVLSKTYRLSSANHSQNTEIDSGNQFLWRANPRRLEAEAIRDAILLSSGQLDRTPPKSSEVAQYNIGELNRNGARKPVATQRRSLYMPIIRNQVDPFLTIFDFPEPSDVHGARDVTTVATQALYMMNSEFVSESAAAAAARLVAAKAQNLPEQTRIAYLESLSREPNDSDYKRIEQYFDAIEKDDDTSPVELWKQVYHALFASAEFRYR